MKIRYHTSPDKNVRMIASEHTLIIRITDRGATNTYIIDNPNGQHFLMKQENGEMEVDYNSTIDELFEKLPAV